MNCQEFWNTMPELGADDHPHLRDCAACVSRMNRQRELAAGLRAVASEYRRVAAPARVETRLLAVFRSQAGIHVPASRRRWIPVLTWVTAFAGVIALAAFLVMQRHPEPAPVTRGVELASLVNPVESQGDYEGFIPLPNAERLAENDEVNLVRVEVPRSAMIALGLEVNPEQAADLVQADVMLGPDGIARAVRFVESESLF